MIRIVLFFLLFQQDGFFYNKEGIPSSNGISIYVKNNQESLIKEYEYLIGDFLFDIYIHTENLSETSGENDIGLFYLPDYIVITNEERFVDYEYKYLSKFKKRTTLHNENTVKAVIFHELTHAYIYQTINVMKNDDKFVSPDYGSIVMFSTPTIRFGSEFITEGICEYVKYYLNESGPLKNVVIPDNETDLLDKSNKINNVYYYSVIFLREFLDKNGVDKGIEILVRNNPPTYEEIINPELFFNRIK